MPRPEPRMVTLTIDGREVSAPENSMLVDGAKFGDVEIPVFCYEPKLGQPVGACRMCLVEIEGIPKLQTACSTAVKDGMVVHTQTERVREAQQAVVEFLLINHPLDCPVCDKGGECPLQDITFGWGAGTSRFIEPKRHFRKPLELSPLVAIDRERCILCYRCVRYSQEVAEDYQLVLLERGAHTFVATFDGRPYVAPFSGNIIELCPVGALTSIPYRFRARPWDIEGAGSVCTLCPSQCNVTLTVRDERVLRVLGRDHDEVDDGWLCDKGRFSYQSMHVDERITEPMVRDGGELRTVSWERALSEAASALGRAQGRVGALAGGEATNEEAFLLARLLREGLDSPDLDSRTRGALPLELRRALSAPALQAAVSDLEFAGALLVLDCEPVDDAPILDLRIRKGVRRRGVRLAVASARPSALDPNARMSVRIPPGAAEHFLNQLLDEKAEGGGQKTEAQDLMALLDAEDVVIVYGEGLVSGRRGAQTARALLNLAARVGAKLLEIPAAGSNGRGLREAGFLPDAGPGLTDAPEAGRGAPEIAAALEDGDLTVLYLLRADPLRTHPDRARWKRALHRATAVIAHESFMNETLREHATVVFPAESYAEKEGTVTHPDGRVQRLRPAIGHPEGTRPEWQVIAELAQRLDHDLGVITGAQASARLFEAVPFYAGLSLERLGGRGVRWPETDAASRLPAGPSAPFELDPAPEPHASNGVLLAGAYRSIWAAPEVEASPALAFLHPEEQRVELSPADARRLGIEPGDLVEVAVNGSRVTGRAVPRAAVPPGTAFLEETATPDSVHALTGPVIAVRKVSA
jgi:NADH-quinone oxidoreductase subunit G